MHVASRRIATVALMACGLSVIAAPASYALVDPVHAVTCLAETPNALTGLVDPAGAVADPLGALAAPELPATHCLGP